MVKKITKNIFLRFLKDRDVYTFFKNDFETRNNGKITFKNFFEGLERNDYVREAINYAFSWSETKSGHRFYYELHGEWCDFIDNYKN